MGIGRILAVTTAAACLAGCDDMFKATINAPDPACFSVTPANGNLLNSILVDGCTGKTWLLVRTRMSDKPEDGYTFQWMALEKYDFQNPVLVNN